MKRLSACRMQAEFLVGAGILTVGGLLKNYELMLVTPTSLSKEQEEEFFQNTEENIKKNKGKVTSKKPMGKKKLVYPIAGQNEAIYTLIEFEGENKTVDELERAFKISGEVLRHGIFKIDPKMMKSKEKK